MKKIKATTYCKNSEIRGRHLLVDFFGVAENKLQNRNALMRILRLALKKGGLRVIKEAGSHKFKGGGKGVTGFALLAESHVAFHTYPECGYMAFDLYSCGKCNPELIVQKVRRYLKPRKVLRIFHTRG